MRRALLFSVLIASTLAAAGFWEKKPYAQWNDQEIARMLVDSPWAKEVIIKFPKRAKDEYVAPPPPPPPPASLAGMNAPHAGMAPGGGAGPLGQSVGPKTQKLPEGATVRVRWESAEPMRQAIARSLFPAGSAEASKIAQDTPELYRLVIDNIPPYIESARFGSLQAELMDATVLKIGSRLTLKPTAVVISANKDGLIVKMDFPREAIQPRDATVTLQTTAGISGIDCAFDLRQMMFLGKLAI